MRIRAGVLVIAVAAGCRSSSTPSNCICTASFAFVTTTVVDSAGVAMAGLTPTITLLRTGEQIAPDGSLSGGGSYVVFTDSEKGKLGAGVDTVRFTVSQGARSTTGDFVIDAPGQCRCHIRKLSGADTLRLQ